jgi:hypothetical protein
MSRDYSTITWGLALIVAALFLTWTESIPWALTAAGAVAVVGGLVKALPVWLAHDAPRNVNAQIIGASDD